MHEHTHLEPGSGYFLYHSIGLFPDKARLTADALAGFAQIWGTADDQAWPASLRLKERFIERWRHCIDAPPGTMTTADNVTTALYSLVGSLPDATLKGRRLRIAADCFPSLHFLLAGMAQRRGFILETVPLRPGEAWVRDEDFMARWTPEVAVALLTHVTSTASHRSRLEALIAHGHAVGSLVGVDITQSVGIIPFSAQRTDADFVVASTLKWLCGVAGAGVLHVKQRLLKECRPELRGWFSQEDIFSWNLERFRYAPDARRFDHGTPSIVACVASLPALDWHASQDPAALLAHNRELGESLVAMAQALKLELISPRNADERGGSIMLRLPDRVPAQTLLEALRANGSYADVRGQALRLSPGNLTTAEGIARLETALFDALRGHR
jgi:kynureninase